MIYLCKCNPETGICDYLTGGGYCLLHSKQVYPIPNSCLVNITLETGVIKNVVIKMNYNDISVVHIRKAINSTNHRGAQIKGWSFVKHGSGE